MKIFHITYGLLLGGIETMLVNIANEQHRCGHDIHVVVINDLVDCELRSRFDPCIKLHLMGRKVGSKNPLFVGRLNLLLLKNAPDVIHLHYATISRYILPHSLRTKMCVTLHAMCTAANSSLLHKAGPVFAISNMVRDDILSTLGLDSVTVYNGVKLNEIRQRKETTERREDGRLFKIVQVSRLMISAKGQDILIRAVSELKRRGVGPIQLTFIGDGESRRELEELAVAEGLNDEEVIFLGSRSQEYIFNHLADYDLFVQPSRWEGFGLTVAEAMAAKLPVLVSDCQAPMEVIDNGRYGLSFEGENVEACADRIEQVISQGYLSDMVEQAWLHVEKTFNIAITARRYLQLYEQQIVNKK